MDEPLSAPLEQKHARAATAPDKWRPERGYCCRPPATPLHQPHAVPLYASTNATEPPPMPYMGDRGGGGPGVMIKQGEKTKLSGEYSAVSASTLDKLSIGCWVTRLRIAFMATPVCRCWNSIAVISLPSSRKVLVFFGRKERRNNSWSSSYHRCNQNSLSCQ